ncbi:MAG: hypothetical protein EU547_00595 [Promethearchaeota archaeon]|nr:MAG: hypothetical protein EU547_00595 [Candidatus Lokiarchaeota archaeon]
MDSEELLTKIKQYFPNNVDLMRHLDVGACWEYKVFEKSIGASLDNDERPKIHYFLYKESTDSLSLTMEKPQMEPDLILYFTEQAILTLIEGKPNADEYFAHYKEIMENPTLEIEVDNKVNKARLKLWRIGYRDWQKDFNF